MNYDSHPYKPAKSILQIPEVRQFIEKFKSSKGKSKSKKSDIEELSLKLIELWVGVPYTPVARLFDKLGSIHHKTQFEIRESIEKKGWAECEEVRKGRSNILLMQPLSAGYKAVGISAPEENKGRGGVAHRHFAHWIKQYFEAKGYKVFLEWKVTGTNHPVDLMAEKDGHIFAYEICITAFDNLTSHLEACFEKSNAISKLTVVVSTKRKLRELKKEIKSNLLLARFEHLIELDVIENYM